MYVVGTQRSHLNFKKELFLCCCFRGLTSFSVIFQSYQEAPLSYHIVHGQPPDQLATSERRIH